jgi:hypothetical protein
MTLTGVLTSSRFLPDDLGKGETVTEHMANGKIAHVPPKLTEGEQDLLSQTETWLSA